MKDRGLLLETLHSTEFDSVDILRAVCSRSVLYLARIKHLFYGIAFESVAPCIVLPLRGLQWR